MSRGMFGAHSAHAQLHAQCAIQDRSKFGEKWCQVFGIWRAQTDQGFGTVLTLDAGDIGKVREIVDAAFKHGFPAGIVHDPSYPVRDGAVTHLIPLDTCGWVFAPTGAFGPLHELALMS